MLDARIPVDGRRAPRHQSDESGAENSNGGHDRLRDGRGGGRRAGHHGQYGGRAHGRGRGHRVHFDVEEFDNFDHEEGSDENPFANMGCIGGAMIIGGMLLMEIDSVIMVIVIGKIRTALLASS